MTRPTRVLLVAYGGGHIPMVLPVMRALREQQPGIELILIALTTAYAVAQAAGEKPLGYAALKHLADETFADEWGARLAPRERHPAVSVQETVAYVGVNFWDMVQQHGMAKAQALHAEKERFSYFPLHFMRRVLAHLKPDAVVATVSPRSEEAALQAAIELGVPTLSMIDWYLQPSDSYCHRKYYADRITVINDQVRQILVNAGVSESKLIVTGNPAFDGLASSSLKEKALAWRASLGWQDKTVVLWAGHLDDYTSVNPDLGKATGYPREVEAQLRSWAQADETRALIIRYHPNEMHLFPQGPSQPRVFVSTREQHVHQVILASDLAVVQVSTVGLEAAVAGKPVVAMVKSPHSLRINFSYERLGVAYGAPEISMLPDVIEHALSIGCVAPQLAQSTPVAPVIAREILGLMARTVKEH